LHIHIQKHNLWGIDEIFLKIYSCNCHTNLILRNYEVFEFTLISDFSKEL